MCNRAKNRPSLLGIFKISKEVISILMVSMEVCVCNLVLNFVQVY